METLITLLSTVAIISVVVLSATLIIVYSLLKKIIRSAIIEAYNKIYNI
jgi:hypothetical protein